MNDYPEFCEICGLEMDEVVFDLWLCRNKERPHLWRAENGAFLLNRKFTAIYEHYACVLASALLSERAKTAEIKENLQHVLNSALDF